MSVIKYEYKITLRLPFITSSCLSWLEMNIQFQRVLLKNMLKFDIKENE